MANTLRRKMFKLGGEVNTHGVGLTSGLNYNRSGYNNGGPIVKPGPDGKPRQHAVFGGIMALVKAAQAAAKLKNPLTPIARYIGGGSKLTARPTKEMLARMSAAERARVLGGAGFGPGGRFTQAGRLSNIVGLGSVPFAGASLLAGPRMTPDERETATDFSKGLDTARGVVEALPAFSGLGFGAEVAGNIGDAVYESMQKDPNYSLQTLPELIRKMSGSPTPTAKEKEGPGPSTVPVTPPMETALTQGEEFAQMKADADARAEMYYNMLSEGGPDKIRALSDAFTQAGAMWDDDKAAALSGFKSGIDTELDRDAALRDEARRLGVSDIVSLSEEERQAGKAKQQMIDQAKLAIISSPDLMPDARAQALKGIEAWEAGVIDTLPINAKQDAADPARLSIGNIYFDPYNLYGGMYVGVSSDEDDPDGQIAGFDSLEEARAHAAG